MNKLSLLVINRAVWIPLVICLLAFADSKLATAQDAAALRATYGRGVHAYFRGQSLQADRLLTEVAQAGSTDPRVFYFRAMARLRSGRLYEAENDMRIGAALEARNPGLGSTISKSLERVQGTHRRKLEKFRRQARLERLGEQRHQSTERYEKLRQREPSVLRREVDVPLEDLTGPGLAVPKGSEGSATSGSSPASPASPAKEPDAGDPFGEVAPAADATEDDDPFAEPANSSPEQPTENVFESSEPEKAPAAELDDDPFAAEETDSADPFGAAGGDEPATVAELSEEDRVEPSKLVGILGRVVGSAMPWKGLELPQMPVPGLGPGPGAGFGPDAPGDEFALGPIESDSNVVPATASEPDAFGAEEPQEEATVSELGDFEDAEEGEDIDDPFSDF